MRRLRRPQNKDHVFNRLLKSEEGQCFDQFTNIFVLAACIGYTHNKLIPFQKTSEQIHWTAFTDKEQNIMKMIALMATSDPSILLEEKSEKMLEIVEGYASGGLEILDKEIINGEDRGARRLDLLIELLFKPYLSSEKKDVLKEMIK